MNTTTTTHRNTTCRSALRGRSIKLIVAVGAAAMLTMTGCNAEQRREFGERDVHDSLASQLARAVNNRSLSIDDDLSCTSTIDATARVWASCVGSVTSGQAVMATFRGNADVEAEKCTAVLVVDIDSVRIVDQPYVQCFDSV